MQTEVCLSKIVLLEEMVQEANDAVASLPDVHSLINEVVHLRMKGILVSAHHEKGTLISARLGMILKCTPNA